MLSNKVKCILSLNDSNLTEYANVLNKTKQSLNKKVQNETYTVSDFIKLCDMFGYTLAFNDDNGKPVITFDISDIPDKKP